MELDIDNFDCFFNRELSWLEFNDRVLIGAQNEDYPLMERLRFLSISANNLDEFFMVRVGSLKELGDADYDKEDPSGRTIKRQLKEISIFVHEFSKKQYEIFDNLLVELKKVSISLVKTEALTIAKKASLDEYFMSEIYPVLTPMAVDSGRPFPLLLNKSLNIAVLLKGDVGEIFATVQVPSVLPRLVPLDNKNHEYCLLEDVIIFFIERLFTAHEVLKAYPYRVTRNADLNIDEDDAEDLLVEIEKSIKQRKRGAAVRLEVAQDATQDIIGYLSNALELSKQGIYYIDGPLNLTFLNSIISMPKFEKQCFPKYSPKEVKAISAGASIFEAINEGDILMHHPYQSFDPVVKFIEEAALDENVLAIKQTLYRVSGNSPIILALERAAELGKQVTVLVEVKARFDEENNIHWAKRLELAGCHVIYGLLGLKTHCKIALIIRRESDGIKRYVHLGTGNYNDVTATLYTDFGMLTANEFIAQDASALFNMLSGYSLLPDLYKLIPAPSHLRHKLLECIEREISLVKEGQKGYIFAKCNSLVDPQIIKALYKASIAGVKIDLVVRGICCLKPKVEGLSENINVTSIVGRFLEHHRVYYFANGGKEDLYLSSADLMPRNLDRRVELMFPISDLHIKKRILKMMDIIKKDNVCAKVLNASGQYSSIKLTKGQPKFDSQKYFMEYEV